jgi:hypothetical protein
LIRSFSICGITILFLNIDQWGIRRKTPDSIEGSDTALVN